MTSFPLKGRFGGVMWNERISKALYYSQAFYLSLQAFWQVVKTPCKSL
jgi:hypothetical protein